MSNVFLFVIRHLHLISELSALLVAIVYYSRIRGSFFKWALPFLALVCISEIITAIYTKDLNWPHVYNFYLISVAESVFYTYVFCHFLRKHIGISVLLVLGMIATITYLIGFFAFSHTYPAYLVCLTIVSFLLTVMALIYLYKKITINEKIILTEDPGFWIALGVSLFFSGSSVSFYLHDYIVAVNLNVMDIRFYNFIPRVLCLVLYGCISTSIILFKKEHQPSTVKSQ